MFITGKDVTFKAVRSGKPGGQRANRRSTKVQMRVKIGDLPLSSAEKRRLRGKLAKHINHRDELEVVSEEERFQVMNRERALERLNRLIGEAIAVAPPRIPTKLPRGAKEERMRRKHLRYEKKEARRMARISGEDNFQ